VFSDITSGASNDLERVTKLAREMVTRLGMSTDLGPMVYGKKDEMVFLGKEFTEQRDYSEFVAEKIDAEVKELVCEAYERAKEILMEHRDVLDTLAEKLLEHETIDAKELEKIFPIPAPKNGGMPIKTGAPPFSLIVADSQTEGKGRLGRTWITQAGKALALSWILYPESGRLQSETLGMVSGLAPVALAEVLREVYDLEAEIKWPNDVLIEGKKVAGVLVDVRWDGCEVMDVVLGIGVNAARESVPLPDLLNFPAISLEEAAGKEISRLDLLFQIMESLIKWYSRLVETSFIQAWDSMLAFKGQQVRLTTERGVVGEGKVAGISDDGSLILISENGQETEYHSGEIQLRLVDRS